MASHANKLKNQMDQSTAQTSSLCPICLKRIHAIRREKDGEIWLYKSCPEHGAFSTPIWRGPPFWDDWQRPKQPSPPDPERHAFVFGKIPDPVSLTTEAV